MTGSTTIGLALLYGVLALILFNSLRNAFRPGLASVPGPFVAKFSSLWRLYVTWQRTFKDDIPVLHKKYNSSLVRLAPNLVCCSDPRAIESIFGFNNEMRKSEMVRPMPPIFQGKKQPTMFAASDNKTHGRLRRPIAGAFAMNSILHFEPVVDRNMMSFFKRIDELFIEPKKPCDIHNWIQYFSFDVITDMIMSRSIGFIKAGGDVDGLLKALEKELDYRGIMMAMPGLDDFIRLNPVRAFLRPNRTGNLAARAKRILDNRISEEKGKEEAAGTGPRDFTDHFLAAQRKDSTISDGQMVGYVQATLIAGSDTTTTALRTAIYYTLKNPWIHERMREELDSRDITYPISFNTTRNELPFCSAVVKEALRYHFPLVGLMERLIPPTGLELPDGRRLPGGVVIGMQPETIGRDKGTYGADADIFNPVRWLQAPGESDHGFSERLKAMNNINLAFGYGPRACLGKHVAEMELYKFIPTLFGLFNMEFVRPNEPWKLRQLFIVKQSNMDMHISWRPGKSLESLKG